MTPEDIARLDAREYEEPGRDLEATRPATDGRGEEDNPVARHGPTGAMEDDPDGKFGSDEQNVLAKGTKGKE